MTAEVAATIRALPLIEPIENPIGTIGAPTVGHAIGRPKRMERNAALALCKTVSRGFLDHPYDFVGHPPDCRLAKCLDGK